MKRIIRWLKLFFGEKTQEDRCARAYRMWYGDEGEA